MCDCKDKYPGDKDTYEQMVTVDIPEHMQEYKKARLENGLSDKICIDPCIFDEIKKLWKYNIETHGCCCGHNIKKPYIIVDKDDIDKMLELGYEQRKNNKKYGEFKPKSV